MSKAKAIIFVSLLTVFISLAGFSWSDDPDDLVRISPLRAMVGSDSACATYMDQINTTFLKNPDLVLLENYYSLGQSTYKICYINSVKLPENNTSSFFLEGLKQFLADSSLQSKKYVVVITPRGKGNYVDRDLLQVLNDLEVNSVFFYGYSNDSNTLQFIGEEVLSAVGRDED